MSEKIKNKIGEELYNKILETGLKSEDFDLINDGNYIPRSRLNEVNGKLKATESKVSSYEKQLNETKALLEGNEDFKLKFEDLNTKYAEDLAAKDIEIVNTSKKFLIENKLRDAGAKHTGLLMNEIDLSKISIENNNLLGMDPVMESLKTNYNDLFITKTTNNDTTKPNNNNDFDTSGEDENWEDLLKDI